MCRIWKKPRLPELTTKQIESFFSRSNSFSWIGLTGGEIFLREDLIEIVGMALGYCKDLCVLHFPTNGYLKERIVGQTGEILKLKPRRLFVTVSLDGPPNIHDKIRGVQGSWANAIGTFLALQDMPGVSSYLSMTLGDENLGLIDETINSIKNVYPKFDANKMMNFNAFQRSSHYFENTDLAGPDKKLLLADIQKALKILGTGPAIKNYLQKNYLGLYETYAKTGHSPLPCQALSASCFINPYGDIFPCGVYDKKIGNLKDAGFKLAGLWKKEEVVKLRNACKNGSCPGCWSPCDAYQSITGAIL